MATGWRQIKAAERTTNSSLITPSFVFTNTSGTNYVFIVHEQESTSPDSPPRKEDCLSNVLFL